MSIIGGIWRIIIRAGERENLITRMIEKNTRVPDQVLGDLDALVGASHATSAQLTPLMKETGIDDLRPLSKTLAERTERAIRDD